MKKYVILFMFLLTPIIVFAADSIENEINSYQQTSEISKITGARQMLIDKIKADDILKAKELYEYLTVKVDTTTYGSFYKSEEYELILLLKRYDVIKSTSVLENLIWSDSKKAEKGLVPPSQDGFYRKLANILTEKRAAIREDFKKNIDEETSDFADLLIEAIISENTQEGQDKENKLADEFLKKYPDSKYTYFIRHYIRYVLKQGEDGWGMYFGVGTLGFNGSLGNYLSNNTSMELGFDILRKDTLYSIDMGVGIVNKIKNQFSNGADIWPADMEVVMLMVGFEVGRKYKINKSILYPYIGITYNSAYPSDTEKNRGLDFDTMQSISPSYGFYWDIKLADHKPRSSYYHTSDPMTSSLRLKLTFSHPDFGGDRKAQIYRLSINWMGTFWPISRDY